MAQSEFQFYDHYNEVNALFILIAAVVSVNKLQETQHIHGNVRGVPPRPPIANGGTPQKKNAEHDQTKKETYTEIR